MVFGIICVCCGEKVEKAGAEPLLFMCQTCDDAPAKPEPPDMSVHTIATETGIVVLEASTAFAGLTPKEQSYAYHLSRADWEGAKICLIQTWAPARARTCTPTAFRSLPRVDSTPFPQVARVGAHFRTPPAGLLRTASGRAAGRRQGQWAQR